VVAAADCAELRACHVAQRGQLPRGAVGALLNLPGVVVIVIKELVVDRLLVLAGQTEADGSPDVIHDPGNVGAHVGAIGVGEHGFVPAADVVADTGRAHQILVSDDAANRHAVAFVVVCHHRRLAEDVVAGLDLLERRYVYGRAPDRNVVVDLHGALLLLSTFFGGTCGDRTHLVLIKSQVPLRFGIGSELVPG
jgi:hypothetical protein